MSLADTIRKTLVPIHKAGYPFIAAFARAALRRERPAEDGF